MYILGVFSVHFTYKHNIIPLQTKLHLYIYLFIIDFILSPELILEIQENLSWKELTSHPK